MLKICHVSPYQVKSYVYLVEMPEKADNQPRIGLKEIEKERRFQQHLKDLNKLIEQAKNRRRMKQKDEFPAHEAVKHFQPPKMIENEENGAYHHILLPSNMRKGKKPKN